MKIKSFTGTRTLEVSRMQSEPDAVHVRFINDNNNYYSQGNYANFNRSDFVALVKDAGITAEDLKEPTLLEQVQALPVGTKFTIVLDSGDEYKYPYIKASLDEAAYLNPTLRTASVVRITSNFAASGHINIVKE